MYTFDSNTASDLHKEAYGFRPSVDWSSRWKLANNDTKQAIWDDLLVAAERREKLATGGEA